MLRLHVEWKCLAAVQGLTQMQHSAETWEQQAQDNLQRLDQVKSLLEESAFWRSEPGRSSTSPTVRGSSEEQEGTAGGVPYQPCLFFASFDAPLAYLVAV